jgi:hypothetical protein
LLAVSLAFPPVQAIANSFLGLFRVQQIRAVEVDSGKLESQLGNSPLFQSLMSENASFVQDGEPQDASSLAEASALAGFAVRLPKDQADAQLNVSPSGRLTFTIQLQQINDLLHAMGRDDVQLPARLDGKTVTVDAARGVSATWGSCEPPARQPGQDPDMPVEARPTCTTLVQMPSPTVSAPEGLDIARLGQLYLEMIGMSKEDAARLAVTIDWTSTFVVPIPTNQASYQDVTIDGVKGLAIEMRDAQGTMLLWVKNGIVYALTTPEAPAAALRLANSLP